MRIEVTWQQDEALKIPRKQYPRMFQTMTQAIHPKSRRKIKLFLTVMFIGTGLTVLGSAIITLLNPIVGGVLLLLFIVVFWIMTRAIREQYRCFMMRLSLYNGQTHTYELTEDSLVQHAPGSTSQTPWRSLVALCVNDQWLVLTKRDFTMYAIPRRAFENDAQLESFLSEIESRAGIERITERI